MHDPGHTHLRLTLPKQPFLIPSVLTCIEHVCDHHIDAQRPHLPPALQQPSIPLHHADTVGQAVGGGCLTGHVTQRLLHLTGHHAGGACKRGVGQAPQIMQIKAADSNYCTSAERPRPSRCRKSQQPTCPRRQQRQDARAAAQVKQMCLAVLVPLSADRPLDGALVGLRGERQVAVTRCEIQTLDNSSC